MLLIPQNTSNACSPSSLASADTFPRAASSVLVLLPGTAIQRSASSELLCCLRLAGAEQFTNVMRDAVKIGTWQFPN